MLPTRMSIDGHDARQLQQLKGHISDVTCCDFTSNFTLVTGSSDKTIRIWDWYPGTGYRERPNSPLRGHKYQVTCVRISPQGSMLASSSVDGTAVLWNVHSLKRLYTMTQVNGDAVRVCRFSPDSYILVTAGDNGAVCVWDLVRKSLIKTLFEHEGTTQSLAFTPDSQYLVTACSLEFIRVWYVQDLVDTTGDVPCAPVAKMDNALDMGVTCVDVSKHIVFDESNPLVREYRLATCGNTNEIKLWTITSRSVLKHKGHAVNDVRLEPFATYEGHISSVTCVRYTNAGNYLASSSLDRLVKIWDEGGACVATLEGHARYVNCVAVSKDASLVASGSSGSNDKTVMVWDLRGNLTLESELDRYSNLVADDVIEARLAEGTDSIDVATLLEKIEDVSEGAVNSCCFHGRDLLAIGSGDKLVRLFSVMGENNNVEETTVSPLEGHTYSINHVEFSHNGKFLASCSLDGLTVIWNIETGEKYKSLPKNGLSMKVCRFSPDDQLLVTAGDDEKAVIWDIATATKIASLEGHLDTVSSACFTPDAALVVTTSLNADFRLWSASSGLCLYVKDDAHDFGIQFCDVSDNLEPVPNSSAEGQQYLVATCGNDSLVKMWRIRVPKLSNDRPDLDRLEVRLWRSLQGHGGNVICVKFSPDVGEFVCSTATDRQARIWSVYSSECLSVLDHDSIVTSCSFNSDCSLLATGCLDKTLWLWRLPQQLVFQTAVAGKIQCRTRQVIDWSVSDVIRWLTEVELTDVIENVRNTSLDGKKLATLTPEEICAGLDLDDVMGARLSKEIQWLKRLELDTEGPEAFPLETFPHEFLCPITHEVMREPVTCSDGHTYEKRAITEWFMSGKYTSPMTNEVLVNTDYVSNVELRSAIRQFLEEKFG